MRGHGFNSQLFGNFHTDVGATTGDSSYRIDQLRSSGFLGHVTQSAGADCSCGIFVFLVHREYKDGELGNLVFDLPNQFHPAPARHGQIRHQNIEGHLAHQLDSLEAIGCLGVDLDVWRFLENVLQSLTHQRVIIC